MGSKKRRRLVIAGILLLVIILLPLALAGLSFIGRIKPDSVLPDSFDLYASVPDPVRLAGRVLNHESLPDIMALAELAPLMKVLNEVKDSGLTENKWVRFAAKGRLDAVFFGGDRSPAQAKPGQPGIAAGRILAAWDMGILSPFLRFLPVLAGRVTVPGLYYVQAGKNSRFEYRLKDGTVFFIGPHKNLLVISNNSALFESVLAGTSRNGDKYGSGAKTFYSRDYDIAFLLSPPALLKLLGSNGADPSAPVDPWMLSALGLLQFPGPVEASLTVLPGELKLRLVSPLGTGSQAVSRIIERNSQGGMLSAMIPANAQYLTLLSAGSLQELLNGVSAIAAANAGGAAGNGLSDWENSLRKADSTAKLTLGMNLDELLFSWTGTQFAVYGLEGRPNPVFAAEIKDEKKRKEVFDKAFKSIFLNENIQLNLDGNRIPRIQVPSFLDSLLSLLGVNVPSPYYTVQNNYLFFSESAETLLAAVNAVRRNEVLPKTELWRTLSGDTTGPSSFTLFYSLDRSLPFFLKGSSAATSILRLYRQGLGQVSLENRLVTVSLNTIPGAGKGIVSMPGYPVELSPQNLSSSSRAKAGNRLFSISAGKDTRLILTRGSDALAVNPLDRTIKEWHSPGSPGAMLYALPQRRENSPGNSGAALSPGAGEGAAWIADSQGMVSLVNTDMESLKGFPLNTGIRLSAPPDAWGGKLFLCGEDGFVYIVDSNGRISRWGMSFSATLRSPPSFLDYKNKTYAAVYPKSFLFGEIFLLDAAGNPLPSWPVPVSGIAFGSPLLFTVPPGDKTGSGTPGSALRDRLLAAFITQAGELTVYTENAETLPGFPLELPGVFYVQPVFDGEYLWIIESTGTLYKISLNGEILSQDIPRLSVKEGAYITVTDLGGSRPNPSVQDPSSPSGAIIFSGEGNALYGYSRHFNSLDGFPLPV
ncbi:MAG: hypothetical protein FWC45_07955, partial [Treponema sp.]|nr:hypothetical protein [Treponema sp.]